MQYKPVALIIRDGWGENHDPGHDKFNAVKLAGTPVADSLRRSCPRTEIRTFGPDVGLPEGIMGNSEVGHQNIGAGRIVDQEIVRINKAFASGTVKESAVLKKVFAHVGETGGRLHLLGLVSDAGVHSMLEHLYGILRLAREDGLDRVCIHAFTDGRDTAPQSGLGYIRQIEAKCREIGVGRIAGVCGRFWSMDRDSRWERVQKAYDCLTGPGIETATAGSAEAAVQQYYDHPLDSSRKGDEFIIPTRIVNSDNKPVGTIGDGDAVIFFNFRGDRPRELTRAFIEDPFMKFDRGLKLDLFYATMTEYEKGLCPNIIFPKPEPLRNIAGMYLSNLGIPQFRCAETEKYPHVTFFFNDYREEPFPGEERVLVPSPKDVPTYDRKPEMSARGVCAAAREAVKSGRYGLIVVNFANADMVGHTGSLEAAILACETVDQCLGELLEELKQAGGAAVITADHGNSDQMWDPVGNVPHTSHTINPVEVILAGEGLESLKLKDNGRLADVAPTFLRLMGLEQPPEMTGECLIL